MARWNIADWRGPSPNIGEDDQTEVRGLVVHIADGWYEGTIAWQRNNDSNVSSHFVVSRDGDIAQVVDTADAAWTQRSGNGEWLSVECEGFTKGHELNPGGWEKMTDAQLDAVARLLLECHRRHKVPLQTTSSATGRGLGHHSMGADWGHKACPGKPIIAQKPAIVRRAVALSEGDDMPISNDDINKIVERTWRTDGHIPAPDDQLKAHPDNTHWMPASHLVSTRNIAHQVLTESRAIRSTQEAILAAFKGLNTASVIDAINKRSDEDEARDAELMSAVTALGEVRTLVISEEGSLDDIAAKVAEVLDRWQGGGQTDVE